MMQQKIVYSSRLVRLLVASLLVLLAGTTLTAARPVLADEEAEVDIVLSAEPSIHVAPGQTLAYKLRIENRGNSTMDYALARVLYNNQYLTPVDTLFQDGDDHVKRITSESIEVYFDEVGQDAARFAVIYLRVADNTPIGTVLDARVDYDWEDRDGNYDLESDSNAAPVVVYNFNLSSPYVWAAIEPQQAPQGARFSVYSNRFVPGERVQPYLQLLDGSRRELSESLRQTVTPDGQVWVHVESDDIAPGSYKMILRGEHSDLEGVADFTVLPPQ
jgi:hypothetical protein